MLFLFNFKYIDTDNFKIMLFFSPFSNLPVIPKGAIFLEDIPKAKPENAFSLDKKANRDLLKYESVAKLHIPKYKNKRFNCLGNLDIYSADKKNEKDKSKRNKQQRYFGKLSLRQLRVRGTLVLKKGKIDKTTVNSFIPLPKSVATEEKNDDLLREYSCLDESTKLYVEGKGSDYSKPQEEASDSFVMEEIFHKVADFNRKTRIEPYNVKLWLDFVDFQDIVAQEDKSFRTENIRLKEAYQPTKAVIDKKMQILERALQFNPSSLSLKLVQMELYQDIWDSEKVGFS